MNHSSSTETRRTFSRRAFLQTSTLASLATAAYSSSPLKSHAVDVFPHSPTPRLPLGLAAYSFRNYLPHGDSRPPKPDPKGNAFDLFQFIDYCAENGCSGAELTSYYFPPDVDAEFLIRIKRHAFLRGVAISGTAVGNVFTHPKGEKRDHEVAHVKKWIDFAAILGAPHIRIFAGQAPKDMPLEQARAHCIEAVEEVGQYAGTKGVFLGIENHGGIVANAPDLLAIVKAVKSPWIGINLDTGNFSTQDPYSDLEQCAPYAVNVQYKGEIHAKGSKPEPSDTARVIQILRKAKYQGYLTLEYEMAEDPWTGVPKQLAILKKAIRDASGV